MSPQSTQRGSGAVRARPTGVIGRGEPRFSGRVVRQCSFAFVPSHCYHSDMSTPTRDQFVAQVIEIVTKRFPLLAVLPADDDFAVRIKPKKERGPGHLASLENLYRMTALDPAEL